MHDLCVPMRAAKNGFSKYSGKIKNAERNRPLLAIRARYGLFGTSMSRNCWVLNGILRKSHFSPQGMGAHRSCKLPVRTLIIK